MTIDRNGNQWSAGSGRDALGNLPGGEMNMSMQDRVINNTREHIERKQHLASMQAAEFANFPRALDLNGVSIPIYKYQELEILGKKILKQRCLDFRDLVETTGCLFFENHPHLRLNAAVGEDVLLEWFFNMQVTLAAAIGQPELDHAAFGAPAGMGASLPPPAVHNKQQPARRQQQHMQQQQQQQQQQYMQQQQQQQYMQQQQQQQQQYMQQQRQQQQYMQQQRQQQQQQQGPANDFDDHYNQRSHTPRGVPQHGGFALAPPHLQGAGVEDGEASRFDDAARIRARNNPSARPF